MTTCSCQLNPNHVSPCRIRYQIVSLTVRNSCPTAPVTPTMAIVGPLGVLAARTTRAFRLARAETEALATERPLSIILVIGIERYHEVERRISGSEFQPRERRFHWQAPRPQTFHTLFSKHFLPPEQARER